MYFRYFCLYQQEDSVQDMRFLDFFQMNLILTKHNNKYNIDEQLQ